MSREREVMLVVRAQSGDREALDELFRDVQHPLFRCISNIICQPELAEDVLQDVFVILFRRMAWLRDPAAFRAWAYRIASRESLRRLRCERRSLTVQNEWVLAEAVDANTPDLDRREMAALLPKLVAQASPASRAVLVLHYLEELTLPEVAEVLGISLGTVKSRLAYGLQVLRRHTGLDSENPLLRNSQ